MAKRALTFRELRRRKWNIEPRKRLLICCEGRVTEPRYFHALKVEVRSTLLDIEIYGRGESPKTLVGHAAKRKKEADREALRRKDDNARYDEVWCVFDVDDHMNIPDALQQAADNNVRLAVSNPCFELWVLLHFQDRTAHISRKHLKKACCNHIKDYVKEVPYEQLRQTYSQAVARARNLDRRHSAVGSPGANPSTGIYLLTERIYELAVSHPSFQRTVSVRR